MVCLKEFEIGEEEDGEVFWKTGMGNLFVCGLMAGKGKKEEGMRLH